jgi:hypothetical protein
MNQAKRLIVKDVQKTTAEEVSVPVLPQFYQIFSKSAKGNYHQTEGVELEPSNRCTDKSAMTLKPDKDIIAEISISDFLFLGCLS